MKENRRFSTSDACVTTFDLVVYYKGTVYLLRGEEHATLYDLECFMWKTCHVYEDEQTYRLTDDLDSPILLPGFLLSMFSTLFLTVTVSLRHDVVPLRYQRWYVHSDPTIYRNSLSLCHLAEEHLIHLPMWLHATRFPSVDVDLSHSLIDHILSLLVVYIDQMVKVRMIILWNPHMSRASKEALQLLHQRVLRLRSETSRRVRVSIYGLRVRMSIAYYMATRDNHDVLPPVPMETDTSS